jgi:hypothetical protein
MPELSVVAVLGATGAAFVLGGAYYAVLGDRLPGAGDTAPWQLAVELLRCLVLCAVVAGLAAEGGVDDPAGGLLLGLALWIGFPLVLWAGAVIHEKTPVWLAAIHAGDWLVKLPAVGMLVAVLG